MAACFRSDATRASPPLSRSVAAMLCSTSTRYAPVPQQGSSTMTFGIGQPVGQVQFLAQDPIHAGDLILDDFRRGVPHAQRLAQLRVVGFQERLVKVLDRVLILEAT